MIEICSHPGCMNAAIPTKKYCIEHSTVLKVPPVLPKTELKEFSGGDVNYYLLEIPEPKRLAPYTAECEDLIEALEMTFAEGNVFKALWRSCNMRAHGHGKRGQDDQGVYDGDKIAYYGERVKQYRKRKARTAALVAAK